MTATPEELAEFETELKNLVAETNPTLFPYMFVEMMSIFRENKSTKEFIDILKDKYTYKDLKELLQEDRDTTSYDFYKEVYNLGMKKGINSLFPNVSHLIEGNKELINKLEKLNEENKQIINQVCEYIKVNPIQGNVDNYISDLKDFLKEFVHDF